MLQGLAGVNCGQAILTFEMSVLDDEFSCRIVSYLVVKKVIIGIYPLTHYK